MRNLITIAAAVAISACATTDGTQPIETFSGYDGARVVTIAPHGGACTSMLCPGLGAQWSGKAPERVILKVMLFNAWEPITSARLMVDGQEHVLHATPGITNFNAAGQSYRESSRDFAASLALARSLAAANKAWIRVGTTGGTVEVAIVDGSTDSKALHAMRRFLAQVDMGRQ